MTVASTTNRADLTITSGTTSYPYAFRIFADADLVVVRRNPTTGAETTLVLNTDYTVTGAGNYDGGNVVLSLSYATTYDGYGMTIRRVLATTQNTSIRNQGAFYPEVHEDVFDRLAMVDQQQQEEIDRSVKLPETVSATEFDPTLPDDVTAGAGRTLLINATGDGFEMGPTSTEISSAQSAATAALAALDSFDDRYLGAKSSDPTLDNDGNALIEGALYWRTSSPKGMQVYNGSYWESASSTVSFTVATFSGDGTTGPFTLPFAPTSKNNLSIDIGGVNQHKSRFDVSGTALTFASATPVGTDNIEVVIAKILPIASADSANVSYTPGGTGALQTDAQTKLRQFVTLADFGATSSNADQTTAIQNALNSGAKVIDGQGLTYRVDNTLNIPSGVTLQNAAFNFANAAANATLIQANGALGSGASFTAATRGAATLAVSSATGIAANTLLYLESGTIFGSGATKNGEFVRVQSAAGTTLTPYRRIQDNYSSSPTFYIPAMLSNITLRNLRMTGRGNGYSQKAMMFYLCQNVRVENVFSEFFGERHLQFQRCINATADGCNFSHCDTSTGLAYGVVVANGTERATITGCNFRDMRHGVTVGAENGVDRYVAVSGNTTTDCTDSGIDCHPQAQYVSITGNVCVQDSTNSGQDGISVQCANATITGNVVQGFSRIGILYQSLTIGGPSNDHPVISGNQVIQPVGSGPIYGIYVQNQRTPGGMRFSVTGNTVDVAQVTNSIGILIEGHASGSDFAGGTISGNTVYSAQIGLKVLMAANKFLRCLSISGNTIESLATATYDCIELTAATLNFIERVIIVGNSLYKGRYGINLTNCIRVKPDANMIQGFGTAATNGTLVGTNDNFTT